MDHSKLKKRYDASKKAHNEKYATTSKKRLMDIIQKKITTIIIGAIAQLEKDFGYLWGMDEDYKNLDSKKIEFFEQWQKTRTAILNHGNNQLRTCLDEIAQYTIKWDRYQTKFIINKEQTHE